MTREHTPNKDFVVYTKISQDLKEKLDSLFVDLSSDSSKVRHAVSEYVKFVEKYPYLNIKQETVNPEDAGFLPCPFVKAIYWNGEFLGFHCLLRKPLLDLPRIKVGRITLKATTADLCCACIEMGKKSKVGIDLFSHITLDSIREHKWKYKEDSTKIDSTRIRPEGKAGRAKVNRKEAFKLFSKGCPKKFIKNQLRIAEATYWRIKKEHDALSRTEKNELLL